MGWLDDLTLSTVIVHLKHDGPSLKGLKEAVYEDGILLRDAMLLEPETSETIAGGVFIPREQVQFMQVIE